MGKEVNIPKSSRMTYAETPFWMLQCLPDRIRYTLDSDMDAGLLKSVLSGEKGFNAQMRLYFKTLVKAERAATGGDLDQALTKYEEAFEATDTPASDKKLRNLLDKIQKYAHCKKSFLSLPPRVANARFFEGTPKINFPRITEKEHLAMG